MAKKNLPLSPSKCLKIQDLFGDALRKSNLLDTEAQAIIETHWHRLRPELFASLSASVNRVLAFTRGQVYVDAIKRVPPHLSIESVKGNDPLEPGFYTFSFEGTKSKGVIQSGLQAALYLLENQHLIPQSFRWSTLFFTDTGGIAAQNGRDFIAALAWNGHRWILQWERPIPRDEEYGEVDEWVAVHVHKVAA